MSAPTHVFFSATTLVALGAASVVSIVGSTIAANVDSKGCTISPDNAGCAMHRPVELEQRSDEDGATWNLKTELDAESNSPSASEPPVSLKALKPAAPEESELDKIFNR